MASHNAHNNQRCDGDGDGNGSGNLANSKRQNMPTKDTIYEVCHNKTTKTVDTKKCLEREVHSYPRTWGAGADRNKYVLLGTDEGTEGCCTKYS